MIRSLLLPLLLFSGCNILPAPGPQTVEVKAPPYNDDEPILAYAIAKATTGDTVPNPVPSPQPTVRIGDVCPTCKGGGTVDYDHDGRADADCTDCRGDGRVDQGDPILVAGDQGSGGQGDQESVSIEYLRKDEFESFVEQQETLHAELQSLMDESQSELKEIGTKLAELAKQPSPSQETTKTPKYVINYLGESYAYNEPERAFIAPSGRRINFTGTEIGSTSSVRICPSDQPNNCVVCPVQRL